MMKHWITTSLLVLGALVPLAACGGARPAPPPPGQTAADRSEAEDIRLPDTEDVTRYDLRGPALRAGHTQTIRSRTTMNMHMDMTLQGGRQSVDSEVGGDSHLAMTIDAVDGDEVTQATEVTVASSNLAMMKTSSGQERIESEEDELVGIRLQSTRGAGGWQTRPLDPGMTEEDKRMLANLSYVDWRDVLPRAPRAVGESWKSERSMWTRNLVQAFRTLEGTSATPKVTQTFTLEAIEDEGDARIARVPTKLRLTLNATNLEGGKEMRLRMTMTGTGVMRVNLDDHSYTLDLQAAAQFHLSVTSQLGGATLAEMKMQGPIHIEVDCHTETVRERAARLALRDDSRDPGADSARSAE